MTVQELIEILKTCNPESVVHLYVEGGNGVGSLCENDVDVNEDNGVVTLYGEEDEDYCE